MLLKLHRSRRPEGAAGSNPFPKNSERLIRCSKKHRFDSRPQAWSACAESETTDLRGLPLGREESKFSNPGSPRRHRVKLQAVYGQRWRGSNCLQKVPQDRSARVRIISPNESELSQRELLGRRRISHRDQAQPFGGGEGETALREFRENNESRTPLCREWAGDSRFVDLTVESSVCRRNRTNVSSSESPIHKAAGAHGEVRASHSSRSAGEPRTFRDRLGEGDGRFRRPRCWREK
jgi:hypothetical protein